MKIVATSVEEYLNAIPQERKETFNTLRDNICEHLPKGFEEVLSYGMIGYVVPHALYPDGYHCNPKLPLPFMNIAVQKNFIALYHMGLYANEQLMQWFVEEYPKHCSSKLDMGKSCIRFKNDDIPYPFIGELVEKISLQEWVDLYEKSYKKK